MPPVCQCSLSVSARLPGPASLRLGLGGVRVTGSASLSLHGRLRLSRDPGRAGGPGGPGRRRKPCGPAGSVSVWHAVAGPPAGRPGAAAPASRHRRARPGTDRRAQALARCGRQGAGGARTPPPRTPPPTPDLPLPGQARAGIGPADSEFKHWLGT